MATGVDTALSNIVSDIQSIAFYGITAVSAMAGGWFCLAGCWKWYESAQWQGEATPAEIFKELLGASICLSITSFFAASGGAAFSATSSGYAVALATSGLTADAAAAANTTLTAVFSLLASIGWVSQFRGVLGIREVGKGKSDMSVWRILGFLFGGSVLADFPNFALSLDKTFNAGVFT